MIKEFVWQGFNCFRFKGTLTQILLRLVFIMNQSLMEPLLTTGQLFEKFLEFSQVFTVHLKISQRCSAHTPGELNSAVFRPPED
jgi:hypothetical protein